MGPKKPAVSRRKWKRFRMTSGAIVMLNKPSLIGLGKPSYVELGPVVDISMGGLAIQYFNSKHRQIDCFELSLSLPGEGIKVEALPFEEPARGQPREARHGRWRLVRVKLDCDLSTMRHYHDLARQCPVPCPLQRWSPPGEPPRLDLRLAPQPAQGVGSTR